MKYLIGIVLVVCMLALAAQQSLAAGNWITVSGVEGNAVAQAVFEYFKIGQKFRARYTQTATGSRIDVEGRFSVVEYWCTRDRNDENGVCHFEKSLLGMPTDAHLTSGAMDLFKAIRQRAVELARIKKYPLYGDVRVIDESKVWVGNKINCEFSSMSNQISCRIFDK